MARLPWVLFTVAGVAGEAIWVALYVGLGAAFSTSVQALADVLGNLTWFLVAGGITILLGWRLAVVLRRPRASPT
jgi:membrane protein DedA with SNARE-associated domain